MSKNIEVIDREVLVLVSGGLDSTACLHFYLEFGRPPEGLFIDYGQPAAGKEISAVRNICDYFNVPLQIFRLPSSSILNTGFIVGRNLLLGAVALFIKPKNISVIAMGIHAGTRYPDCTPEFLQLLQSLYDLSSDKYVSISAPFIEWTKADIWEYCRINEIPVDLTYSCEFGTDPPCGSCLSCRDRKVLSVSPTANVSSTKRK
jgi:7-cyano-7-deazaguanine synthase